MTKLYGRFGRNSITCIQKRRGYGTDYTHHVASVHVDWIVGYIQVAPIKNNPLEKILYFSHGSLI